MTFKQRVKHIKFTCPYSRIAGSTSSTLSQSSIPPMPPNVVAAASALHGPPGVVVAPHTSSNINLTITQLGKVAPDWVPDSVTATCMQCDVSIDSTSATWRVHLH